MRAAIYLSLFVVLIMAGILVKRLAGHPEFMMVFHLPAAVFLVLGGLEVRKYRQTDYEEEIKAIRERLVVSQDAGEHRKESPTASSSNARHPLAATSTASERTSSTESNPESDGASVQAAER